MKFLAFDTETHLIQPGLAVPPLVCSSMASEVGKARIYDKEETEAAFTFAMGCEQWVFCGINIAYDMAVMAVKNPALLPQVFELYAENRVYDCAIAQALDAIAKGHLFIDPRTGGKLIDPLTKKVMGRYSLAILVDLVLGRKDAKAHNFWQLRYAILENLPIHEWPEEARTYPLDDANNSLEVAETQMRRYQAGDFENLHDMGPQARAAFAMHLASAWGFRTDPIAVKALTEKAEAAHKAALERFTTLGLYGSEDGKKSNKTIKTLVAKAFGATGQCPTCRGTGEVPSLKTGAPIICKGTLGCDGSGLDLNSAPTLPRTPTGGITADRDTLEESGDETLEAYAEAAKNDKIKDTYIPYLWKGVEVPINPRPNVLVASGRTSYDDLLQLFPRKGGVRECIIARPGYVLCSVDYASGELCTLAQVCLWVCGFSRMAEVINATGDPGALHSAFAAAMHGVDVEEFKLRIKAKDPVAAGLRYAAKAANFGFPGGMGAAKLAIAKRKEGLRFCQAIEKAEKCGVEKITQWRNRPCSPVCKRCVELAQDLRDKWFQQWPEIEVYFSFISDAINSGGRLEQFKSRRVRGDLDFCNGANTLFQGLLADGAKHALWNVSRECYTDRTSPLYGSRPIGFFHDEVVSEIPEWCAHEAAYRKTEVMISSLKEYVPDVVVAAEPALMHRLSKDAAAVFDDKGRLIPWVPKEG